MPYTSQAHNRRRMVRAILSGLVLACLFLLLVLAPPRILAWAGLSFGSLTMPEAVVVAVDEPVAALATFRTPPIVESLTFPSYAEWEDLEATCIDCDSSLSYGIDGYLDAVDNETLSRLEHASGVGAGTAASHGASARGSSFGGGGLGGGPTAAGSARSSAEPGTGDTSESASGDLEGADGTTAGSESPAPAGASGAPRAASTTPDLILSRITPNDELAGTLPQDVVQALLDSPAGSETVHSGGEPEVISQALSLEEAPAASANDADGGQQDQVPEPVSLLLVGLGLSAGVWRHRAAR